LYIFFIFIADAYNISCIIQIPIPEVNYLLADVNIQTEALCDVVALVGGYPGMVAGGVRHHQRPRDPPQHTQAAWNMTSPVKHDVTSVLNK